MSADSPSPATAWRGYVPIRLPWGRSCVRRNACPPGRSVRRVLINRGAYLPPTSCSTVDAFRKTGCSARIERATEDARRDSAARRRRRFAGRLRVLFERLWRYDQVRVRRVARRVGASRRARPVLARFAGGELRRRQGPGKAGRHSRAHRAVARYRGIRQLRRRFRDARVGDAGARGPPIFGAARSPRRCPPVKYAYDSKRRRSATLAPSSRRRAEPRLGPSSA